MRFKIIFLVCFIIFWKGLCQELPPIKNFSPKDYHAENQNWSISQSPDKTIYVANNRGLLEFKGAEWVFYDSPNETVMRSVNVVKDRIYTGCYAEFGYWTRSQFDQLVYTSISQGYRDKLLEDEEFWNIVDIQNYIVFQSLKRIYIYNTQGDTLEYIDSSDTITKIFRIGDEIFFYKLWKGIYKIEGGKEVLVNNDAIIKGDEVIQLFGTETDLTILTKHKGFYKIKDGKLTELNEATNNLLSGKSLYNVIRSREGNYVLGTISDGLMYLDGEGALKFRVGQDNGLLNSTILSLFEDIDGNIWVGLDHGISYLNIKAPFSVYEDLNGNLGSVYASIVNDNKLYLGTNQGLFYKPLNGLNDFRFIDGTQGQVWCLKLLKGKLFCGHNSGTFLIDNGVALPISDIQGTWDIISLEGYSDLLLQGNYDGLHILKNYNGNWRVRNKIEGFDNSSRYFETINNTIFVNHEYKGVFRLNVDRDFRTVKSLTKDTSIRGANSSLIKYRNDILYAYKKGILKYDRRSEDFKKDTLYSKLYEEKEYESGKLVVDKRKNRLWSFNKSCIHFLSTSGLSTIPKINTIPLSKEIREDILGYENIIPLDEHGNYLLGKTSGYIVFNENSVERVTKFIVKIDEITNGLNNLNLRHYDTSILGDFKNHENDFVISFSVRQFNKYLPNNYRYKLEGAEEGWSHWSKESNVSFKNLPYGNYKFLVQAKVGNVLSKNIASYQFRIAKPWFLTNFMIICYFAAIAAFSLFMHNVYKTYYKKQRRRLIEENERVISFNKVQNEKEIASLKSERLEIEYKSKSKELAVATMNLLKKNELLTTIKEKLNEVKDVNRLTSVIKIIDQSLKESDDWALFKEAFNNADQDFLKKVKEAHPNLSPNDLKLCAYLRLNLSSKEISKLLHISPRSVEIKRYRLRKKLNLNTKENLVNYILEL